MLVLFALDQYGAASRVYGPAVPLSSLQVDKHFVNSPQESYRFWKSRGLKGRIIVYVADQWKRIDLKQYEDVPLYRPYPLRLFNPSVEKERKFLDDDNFLYMASITGLARQVTAVLSERGYEDITRQAEKAKDVIMHRGDVRLPHYGFPRLFTTAAGLRGPGEPVILFVSASYFRDNEPKDLFRTLSASGIIADYVGLCRERQDDSVSDREREKLVRFAQIMDMANPGRDP